MAAFSIKEGWDVCRELSRSRESVGVWEEGIFKEKGNFFEILAFWHFQTSPDVQ